MGAQMNKFIGYVSKMDHFLKRSPKFPGGAWPRDSGLDAKCCKLCFKSLEDYEFTLHINSGQDLPTGWAECYNSSRKRHYYYNKKNTLCIWTRPYNKVMKPYRFQPDDLKYLVGLAQINRNMFELGLAELIHLTEARLSIVSQANGTRRLASRRKCDSPVLLRLLDEIRVANGLEPIRYANSSDQRALP